LNRFDALGSVNVDGAIRKRGANRMFGVWTTILSGTRGQPALFVGFSTRQRGTRIRDPDVYACSDSFNRDSP